MFLHLQSILIYNIGKLSLLSTYFNSLELTSTMSGGGTFSWCFCNAQLTISEDVLPPVYSSAPLTLDVPAGKNLIVGYPRMLNSWAFDECTVASNAPSLT